MRDLFALHNLDGGCVVCHPRPGIQSTANLAEDIMVALGKSWKAVHAVPPRERWRLAETWLRAERTAHLIVVRGHLLAPGTWTALARMARRCELTVWIVIHQPRLRPSHARALRRHRGVDIRRALDELRVRLPTRTTEQGHSPSLGPDGLTGIRRLASPAHAALLAIAVTSRSPLEKLAGLHRYDFSPSGSEVRLSGRTVAIPAPAQAAVRALHLATTGWVAPVFLTTRGERMQPSQLAAMLRAGADQAGIVLAPEMLAPSQGNEERPHVVRLMPDARVSRLIRKDSQTYLAKIPKDVAADISLRID